MNRTLSLLAVVLLLVTAAGPVAGLCCVPVSRVQTMHGSMPCCASSTCAFERAVAHPNAGAAILITPGAAPAFAPVALTAVVAPMAAPAAAVSTQPLESPPPFLLHEQFRI